MKGPEAKLWQRLHLKLYDVFWTRIENSASTGSRDPLRQYTIFVRG
jgi:hypothetical protein